MQYGFEKQLEVGKKANREIVKYLKSLSHTLAVIDVEEDKMFQEKDIDLIYIFLKNKKIMVETIEIKGDMQEKTGNFFMETVSNKEKKTKGCFLYSEADYFFYYFINTNELNVIPLKKARKYVIAHFSEFKMREVQTKVGGSFYESQGLLVPKGQLSKLGVYPRNLTQFREEKQTKMKV